MDWSALLTPVVAGLIVLAIVVGIVRAATGRDRPHRPPEAGESVASGMLGDLVDVFQPSRVHLSEERERRRTDVVQRPSEGGGWDVDLEAGTVTIRPGASLTGE